MGGRRTATEGDSSDEMIGPCLHDVDERERPAIYLSKVIPPQDIFSSTVRGSSRASGRGSDRGSGRNAWFEERFRIL